MEFVILRNNVLKRKKYKFGYSIHIQKYDNESQLQDKYQRALLGNYSLIASTQKH